MSEAGGLMRRYFIVDRYAAESVAEARADLVQVRDKEMPARELVEFVRRVRAISSAKVLVNDRADIALLSGADGVHLRGNSIAPHVVRAIAPVGFLIAVSCHSAADVCLAEAEGADFAVLGPIFDTPFKRPIGLRPLHEAAHSVRIPVFALGGITEQNAAQCLRAGAAGIAGIRMFIASGTASRSAFRADPLESA